MTLKTAIRDGSGNSYLTKVTEKGELYVYPADYYLQVAQGQIHGAKQYVISGYKVGVSTTVLDDLSQISGTTTLPNPNGIQLAVSSSSASDTLAGTGIRRVTIYYLDTDYKEKTEGVTLNGTTPVNTSATNIQRVQWMHALEVGSNNVAVGNISLKNTAGTTTYEVIATGGNMSLTAHFTIPANKTGYILGWNASGVTKALTIRLRATVRKYDRKLIPGVFIFQDVVILNNSTGPYIRFPSPLACPAKTDIKVSALADVSGGDAITSFTVLLQDII